MKIGRMPRAVCLAEIGKWYIGMEIKNCPPCMIRTFKPYIILWFFKMIRHPDHNVGGTDEGKKIGGWITFTFPWAINISITK